MKHADRRAAAGNLEQPTKDGRVRNSWNESRQAGGQASRLSGRWGRTWPKRVSSWLSNAMAGDKPSMGGACEVGCM